MSDQNQKSDSVDSKDKLKLPCDTQPKHKLRYKFKFMYFMKKFQSPKEKNEYESSLIDIASFDTVEDFWAIYNRLVRPENVMRGQVLHLFKDGKRPMWEDNLGGGVFNIKFAKRKENQNVNLAWEDLVLSFIGDQFDDAGEDVDGISFAPKIGGDRFSIWTQNAENEGAKKVIADKIKEMWKLPPSDNFEYRSNASRSQNLE